MAHAVNPHVLGRDLVGASEAMVTVPADPGRALLVLPNAAADSFGASAGLEGVEARAVSPAEISGTCARHGLALVALYGVLEPEDLSVLTVEVVSEIFEVTK